MGLCNLKEKRAALSYLWGSCEIAAALNATSGERESKEDTLIVNASENRCYAASVVNTESLNNVQRHQNDTTRLTPHQ